MNTTVQKPNTTTLTVKEVCAHLQQQGLRVFVTSANGRYLFRVKNNENTTVAVASNKSLAVGMTELVAKTTPPQTVTQIDL